MHIEIIHEQAEARMRAEIERLVAEVKAKERSQQYWLLERMAHFIHAGPLDCPNCNTHGMQRLYSDINALLIPPGALAPKKEPSE